MSESPDVMNDAFEHRCRPRQFEEVCVLALDDHCSTDELSWFIVGIDSQACAGIRGFVFELAQFHRRSPREAGFGYVMQLMLPIYKRGGLLNWLHGERFVEEWKRTIMGPPPENFETEREAVDALKSVFRAQRIRPDLPRRLTSCGLSPAQIANAAGLFETDVRRIAAGQQEPSDAVTLLISSTLDSLTTESEAQQPDGTT